MSSRVPKSSIDTHSEAAETHSTLLDVPFTTASLSIFYVYAEM
jgi:hypothetical protein